ncbi:uncharacterized protein STEHIDRAFT_136093 [Stereum hirsutum FP-91666 SS1]|uniref:uncharacterized protein n=1 Tax=Stereum hirsutum (strain FP-91666) TaxID=721885 RepID=UPI000440DB0D|nr:uncharacterized protein STEHIDRAFT_136093 [Stereum hirsutum FP-91666 SS1]EIM92061.1 hypothetical protein STEHIDRAFT_136093 [Stereum hirsutum FP-91666 SS1]
MSFSSSPLTEATGASNHLQMSNTHLEVRFDEECVLIPDNITRSRIPLPRFVSKSYSVPLWKRRGNISPDATPPNGQPSSPPSQSAVDEPDHFSLTVAIPRLSMRSPSPGRSGLFDEHHPPSPCLIHRDPSSPPLHRPRRPSLPTATRHDLATVPLRPCCVDCVSITEQSLAEGDNWTEHFTRAARKKRSLSVDAPPHARRRVHTHHLCHDMSIIGLTKAAHDIRSTDTSDVIDEPQGFLTVSVDEVDRVKGIRAEDELKAPKPPSDESTESDDSNDQAVGESPEDGPAELHLPPLISRSRPVLSPIPSTNASVDDLFHPRLPREQADSISTTPSHPQDMISTSLPSEPNPFFSLPTLDSSPIPTVSSPRTPSESTVSSSPNIGSPTQSPSTSPKIRIHLPSRASFLRAGSEVLRSVTAFGSPGVGVR